MAKPVEAPREGAPPVEEYLAALFWREDPVLTELLADQRSRAPMIHAGPDQGRVLQILVRSVGARRVIEVGTLFGYSAIWMGRALPPGGRLDTVEFNPVHAEAAQTWAERAGVGDRVTVHRGAALDVLPTLTGPCDVFYMDAVKTEYVDYLDHALRLVRPGGLILADNLHWGGKVADPTVTDADTEGLRAYLRRIATEPRLDSTVLNAGDGLGLSLVLPPV